MRITPHGSLIGLIMIEQSRCILIGGLFFYTEVKALATVKSRIVPVDYISTPHILVFKKFAVVE